MKPAQNLLPFLSLALILFCQCSGHGNADGYGQEYPLDSESYAAIDSCMAYMGSDPERAHSMLDSVREAGVMSRQRCQYLHAMVVFEGEDLPDSALMMCDRLLDAGDFGSDTLVLDYLEYLKLMAQDAASRHDMKASTGYLQRALTVNDSIHQHELLRAFSEQMSLHMVQEAQVAQMDAEYKLSRHRMLTALLGIIVLTLIVIHGLIRANRRRRRALQAVQQDLQVAQVDVLELEQQLEVKDERSLDNMEALYQRIVQVMTSKQLYLNPDLDIRTLAEEVGSSRTSISTCINGISGKTFRVWLSEYRLRLFVEMLGQYPDESIEALMTRCGYKEQSTLRRQFKALYGMTAGEYRKQQAEHCPPTQANNNQ